MFLQNVGDFQRTTRRFITESQLGEPEVSKVVPVLN
jgi:hypothetical protein